MTTLTTLPCLLPLLAISVHSGALEAVALLPQASLSPVASSAASLQEDGFDDFGSGNELEPGVLPGEATPEACALFQALCAAPLAPGAERRPVQSFDLVFDLRVRAEGSHDVDQARFLFYAPENWISSQLSPSNRLMRGPAGDWLVAKDRTVELKGRELAEDRRQLDDSLTIAHNFVKLTDPERLRIAALALAGTPPGLPIELLPVAAELDWLVIESPDLRLFREGAVRRSNWDPETNYRALLGLDPATRLPTLVLIDEARQKQDLTRAQLVWFSKYLERDGYLIPHLIRTYRIDPQARDRFAKDPELRMDLFRQRGSLNPADLGPRDFVPESIALDGEKR